MGEQECENAFAKRRKSIKARKHQIYSIENKKEVVVGKEDEKGN